MKVIHTEQKSDEWHYLRKGKITGTDLKALTSTRKDTREGAMYEFLAEKLTNGLVDQDENAMARGNRLEPEARIAFEEETGLSVQEVGLCISDEYDNIANSPDGIIDEENAIEIKCPLPKKYVEFWDKSRVPDEYWEQSIQYFIVNEELKTLYFVMYCPEIGIHPLHIVELHRGEVEDAIESIKKIQIDFLKEADKKYLKLTQ